MRAALWALLAVGCGVQTREARALQPNPLLATRSPDDLTVSEKLFIYQRDQNLPRDYQFRNWAQFAVVSRDRLRFHVGIVRVEESDADTQDWEVWLEDEHGRKLMPEGREVPRINRVVLGWKLYPYRPGDPWCRKPPCLQRVEPGNAHPGEIVHDVYEGQADYMFHDPTLLARDRERLSLVLRRGGVEYRYSWTFGDGTEVHHYGRTAVDDELGTIAVPGPYTELAGTIYEDGR